MSHARTTSVVEVFYWWPLNNIPMITCHINLYGGRKLQILDDFINKLNYFTVVVVTPWEKQCSMVLFSRYIIGIICTVLDPDIKAALKISVYRGPRRGGTPFARDNFITTLLHDWMFYRVTQKRELKYLGKKRSHTQFYPFSQYKASYPTRKILNVNQSNVERKYYRRHDIMVLGRVSTLI